MAHPIAFSFSSPSFFFSLSLLGYFPPEQSIPSDSRYPKIEFATPESQSPRGRRGNKDRTYNQRLSPVLQPILLPSKRHGREAASPFVGARHFFITSISNRLIFFPVLFSLSPHIGPCPLVHFSSSEDIHNTASTILYRLSPWTLKPRLVA